MVSEKCMLEVDSQMKKRISNEKRLKAITAWKKRSSLKAKSKPVHKIYEEVDTSHPKLFDSDDEIDEKYEDCFKVRPQFEGPHGQELLEMSSAFSERFKLDERFIEDDNKPDKPESFTVEYEEKEKNLKILESVLGHEIPVKNAARKRHVRFDPEDENAAKYVKDIKETSLEKPKKKKSKKENAEKVESSIPISTEQFIEVSSNLKDILNSSSAPFSLTQKFNLDDEEMLEPLEENNTRVEKNEDIKDNLSVEKTDKTVKNNILLKTSDEYFSSTIKQEPFFVKGDDHRLKEGIEFFKRPKPLDEIREDWQKRRKEVLDLLKRKNKSSQKSHSEQIKRIQQRNITRRNFKK